MTKIKVSYLIEIDETEELQTPHLKEEIDVYLSNHTESAKVIAYHYQEWR